MSVLHIVILLFILHAEHIMWIAGLDESQTHTTLIVESEEGLKRLLMKVKEESEKAGLKLTIQKMKIMASGPIISWSIDGETVADYFFGLQNHCMVIAAMKLKDAYSLEGNLWPT